MLIVGYLHMREADSIRYPIIKENDDFYFIYCNKKININYNLSSNDNIIIMDKSLTYTDHLVNKWAGFPLIYINGVQTKNENIILL